MAKWLLEWETIDPTDTTRTWRIGIPQYKLQTLTKNGHDVKRSRIMLIGPALQALKLLASGWDRPGSTSCVVYAGEPTADYRGPKITVPPPPQQRFLVFVLPDGTIDDWAWRPNEETNPDLVDGIKGTILWQR